MTSVVESASARLALSETTVTAAFVPTGAAE